MGEVDLRSWTWGKGELGRWFGKEESGEGSLEIENLEGGLGTRSLREGGLGNWWFGAELLW